MPEMTFSVLKGRKTEIKPEKTLLNNVCSTASQNTLKTVTLGGSFYPFLSLHKSSGPRGKLDRLNYNMSGRF